MQRCWGESKWFRRALSACMAVALVSCGGGGGPDTPTPAALAPAQTPLSPSPAPSTEPATSDPQRTEPVRVASLRIEPYERVATTASPKSTRVSDVLSVPPAVSIDLGPLGADAVRTKSAAMQRPDNTAIARQIGLARPVGALTMAADVAHRMAWQATPSGGQATAASLRSEGAAGLRLGLLVNRLPESAQVRVRPSGSTAVVSLSGQAIVSALDRNRMAGDLSEEGRTYWLPAVAGEAATLEIELPPGTDPSRVEVSVPRLSHLWWTLESVTTAPDLKFGEAGACNADAMCSPDYAFQTRSIARMEYVKQGQAYLCTGSLMADVAASGTPYFLGANHCVGDQTTASTLSTYWFYRAAACNSNVLDPAATRVHGGATLLYASAVTDTSFMRLTGSPPDGAVHAGSMVSPVAVGTALAGLHHPAGDFLKISLGNSAGFARCQEARCTTSNVDEGNFLVMRWTLGTTESGSSGSPVLATVGAQRYIVGQLYGGTASCTRPDGTDYYGRFDQAYPSLSAWLGTPTGG